MSLRKASLRKFAKSTQVSSQTTSCVLAYRIPAPIGANPQSYRVVTDGNPKKDGSLRRKSSAEESARNREISRRQTLHGAKSCRAVAVQSPKKPCEVSGRGTKNAVRFGPLCFIARPWCDEGRSPCVVGILRVAHQQQLGVGAKEAGTKLGLKRDFATLVQNSRSKPRGTGSRGRAEGNGTGHETGWCWGHGPIHSEIKPKFSEINGIPLCLGLAVRCVEKQVAEQ